MCEWIGALLRGRRQAKGAIMATDFDRLVQAIETATGKGLLSGKLVERDGPPMLALHLTLDRREYVLALIPTDLPRPGDAGVRRVT